jgi:transposase InsO family protein
LLDGKKWRTGIELSVGPFEYLEIFHNRHRRHSSLGMLTPADYEKLYQESTSVA